MKITKLIIVIFIILLQSAAAQTTTDIRLNQIGFYPNSPKRAIVVESPAEEFFVVTADRQDTVFTGNLGPATFWQYSGETVKQADFSGLSTSGSYVLVVPGVGTSPDFDIKPRTHQQVARALIKALYFQRMSIDLKEQYAGTWHRPMGHPDTEVLVHASAATPERPEGTVISCPRGWYDAGDFNKYIVNSGISTYTMLAIYEHYQEYAHGLETNIPESGNTIPDVLDETLWNIRWMLTMQDPHDGGVYHKCTHANFSGAVMPHQATAPRYVVQKSSTATLDFAAVMAQASRIFREFESELPGLADSCLTAALHAWQWARKNPDVYYDQGQLNSQYDPDINTGAYGDSDDDDEFKWAATELYITTKQDSFITIANPFADNSTSVPGWRNVETLAFYSLAHHRKSLTAAVDSTVLKNRLIQFADDVKAELGRSAYHVMMDQFYWGSNSLAANQAMAMLNVYRLTGDTEYLNAAIENIDYCLGRNATTYCFVTGHGDKPPMNPHHRQSEADDIVEPIPGFLVGGPNDGQQDNCPGYPSDLPARSYVDDWCSYASNEITINWNSPMAYATVGVEAALATTGAPNMLSVQLVEPAPDNVYTASEEISLTAESTVEKGTVTRVEFFADESKIGETAAAPYTVQWQAATPGIYDLRAKATTDEGYFVFSKKVQITVQSAESSGDILFIADSQEFNSGDNAIHDLLLRNGYHVELRSAEPGSFPIQDKDLVIVSSTVSTTRYVRRELTNPEVPILSWELSLFDDFGWTGRRRNSDIGYAQSAAIHISNESHPIAGELSGTQKIFSSPQELTWGVPNENAAHVAALTDDPEKAAIFTYNAKDVMYNGETANAHRVAFCLSDKGAAFFTPAGTKLFEQAVEWAISGVGVVVQDNEATVPDFPELSQNYPNPFNNKSTIEYRLHKSGRVRLAVYNSMGQKVLDLVNQTQTAGAHTVIFDTGALASGTYFYRLETDNILLEKKLMLVK